MDIKDFILVGGGILITMVIGHGFWLAWRAKREPLRLDIVPDLIPDDVDEMERLRGELPNGGARVVNRHISRAAPENLELDLLGEEALLPHESRASQASREPIITVKEPALTPVQAEKQEAREHKAATRTKARQAPPRKMVSDEDLFSTESEQPMAAEVEPSKAPGNRPARVREVNLVSESRARVKQKAAASRTKAPRTRKVAAEPAEVGAVKAVEELLIINILARRGERFAGDALVTALRSQGLRYGEMNIFHRVDPTTKAKLYSVANAIEPGTFDLADLNALQSPGMTFFLQLPGPDDALGVFNDMLEAARNVAAALNGDLRDEDLSVMTGQTTEHMRQRIADYARRRLSKRA